MYVMRICDAYTFGLKTKVPGGWRVGSLCLWTCRCTPSAHSRWEACCPPCTPAPPCAPAPPAAGCPGPRLHRGNLKYITTVWSVFVSNSHQIIFDWFNVCYNSFSIPVLSRDKRMLAIDWEVIYISVNNTYSWHWCWYSRPGSERWWWLCCWRHTCTPHRHPPSWGWSRAHWQSRRPCPRPWWGWPLGECHSVPGSMWCQDQGILLYWSSWAHRADPLKPQHCTWWWRRDQEGGALWPPPWLCTAPPRCRPPWCDTQTSRYPCRSWRGRGADHIGPHEACDPP